MATEDKGSKVAATTSKVPQNVKTLAKGNLKFSLSLYEKIGSKNDGGNVFFSPFSITVALQMTHVGARKNTAKELKDGMQLEEFTQEEDMHRAFSHVFKSLNPENLALTLTLQTANRIYVQERFEVRKEFSETLLQDYRANAISADFVNNAEKARRDINAWVEDKTGQKIQNLMPRGILDELTAMVIVNAIYFKGIWAKKFNPENNYDGEFHRRTNDVVKTKFMRQEAQFPFAQNDDLGFKMVELSYIGDMYRLAMYILLPNQVEGLEDLEKQLNHQILKSTMDTLMKRQVKIVMPKFQLEQGMSLSEVLKSVGIKELFSETDADLTGISSERGLYVSHVFHEAFVEVNEQGTEAAAATAAHMLRLVASRAPRVTQFIADHPFMFFIYDKETEIVLFLGRLTNPPNVTGAAKI